MISESDSLFLALKESAKEAGHTAVIKTRFTKLRKEAFHRTDKHTKGGFEAAGRIIQFNNLNQFGRLFDDVKEDYGTAEAICGYLTCATVLLLQQELDDTLGDVTVDSMNRFVNETLCDFKTLEPALRQCMQLIQENRHSFWAAHGKACAERNDLMQWVANYEISDCLKELGISNNINSHDRANTVFVRYNQWPYRLEATSDELERLQEERRFGGVGSIDTQDVTYQEEDSVYFIERFDGTKKSTFFTPEQWELECCDARPRVLAIDLQGHYVAALSCIINMERHLFIFNTTSTNYLVRSPAVAWSFDSMFSAPEHVHSPTRRSLERATELL